MGKGGLRDWNKRIWLFDVLVCTVIGYNVEIWGWKKRKELEKHERYLRWVWSGAHQVTW